MLFLEDLSFRIYDTLESSSLKQISFDKSVADVTLFNFILTLLLTDFLLMLQAVWKPVCMYNTYSHILCADV